MTYNTFSPQEPTGRSMLINGLASIGIGFALTLLGLGAHFALFTLTGAFFWIPGLLSAVRGTVRLSRERRRAGQRAAA